MQLITERARRAVRPHATAACSREGAIADVVVFDPETVGSEPATLVRDLPGDSARLTAGSQGVVRVLVNGTAIVEDGKATGATPGTVLRSGRDTETVHAR